MSLCEIDLFIKRLKEYESNLVLLIFDFVFAVPLYNNCLWDIDKIFLYCFGLSLEENRANELRNSVFNYVNTLMTINIIKNPCDVYNLKYYMEGCVDHYIKNYDTFYCNLYNYNYLINKNDTNKIKLNNRINRVTTKIISIIF